MKKNLQKFTEIYYFSKNNFKFGIIPYFQTHTQSSSTKAKPVGAKLDQAVTVRVHLVTLAVRLSVHVQSVYTKSTFPLLLLFSSQRNFLRLHWANGQRLFFVKKVSVKRAWIPDSRTPPDSPEPRDSNETG